MQRTSLPNLLPKLEKMKTNEAIESPWIAVTFEDRLKNNCELRVKLRIHRWMDGLDVRCPQNNVKMCKTMQDGLRVK